MTWHAALLAVALAILAALWLGWAFRPRARERGHRRRQDQARRVLSKINTIPLMPQRLAYLRKVDPLTFEELLLEAFERRGFNVARNTHYSGDGGVDGVVTFQGERFLVQAKRYGKHINRRHVEDFCRILDRCGCRGFFIHTGRTGAGAKTVSAGNPRLTILSGQRLLDFLNSGQLAREGSNAHGAMGD